MSVLVLLIFFAVLGYAVYQYAWGWWQKNRRFPPGSETPNLDTFTQQPTATRSDPPPNAS